MDKTQLHQFAYKAQQQDLIHDPEHIRKTNEDHLRRLNKRGGF